MIWKKERFNSRKPSLFTVRDSLERSQTRKCVKQVVRSSASIGANYIEANEALSKRDFRMHVKICRKEAKETAYWLRLLAETNAPPFVAEATQLRDEAIELKKIFSSMLAE
jgi:four helix bundle protein